MKDQSKGDRNAVTSFKSVRIRAERRGSVETQPHSEIELHGIREKSARLKALRLAKEAADKASPSPGAGA